MKYLLILLPLIIIATIGVCGNDSSVCGWQELMDGNIIQASFKMFNEAWSGWVIGILFFIYQIMLILKTRNLTLSFVTGIIFAAMYATSELIKPASTAIIFTIISLQLGAIIYIWLFK